MKKCLLGWALIFSLSSLAQCPFAVNLTSAANCPGATLMAGTVNIPNKIVWYQNGSPVSTVNEAASFNPNGITVAGVGGFGSGASQLEFPEGIFVDATGDLYVSDEDNFRIQEYTPGAAAGITVAGGNGLGSALNQLNGASGIFVDGAGNMYISDYGNYRVMKWVPGAAAGVVVAGGNGNGSAANQLDFPTGIYLDAAGNIYVADHNNNRVQRWAPGAVAGVTVAGGNGAGNGTNQLMNPSDVFVDAAGNIYVVDDGNNRVQEWVPGAISGVTVAGGNGAGAAANQLNSPFGLCVDGNGDIFVGDAVNNRVQEWMPGATAGITVAGGNGTGVAANQMFDPRYVRLDVNGNLYVSEDADGRVQEFTVQSTINNTYTAAVPGTYTAVATNASGCSSTSNAIVIQGLPVITMLSKNGFCAGDSLAISSPDLLQQIIWMNNGATVAAAHISLPISGAGTGIAVAGGNGAGAGANQLNDPLDAVVDAAGNIYVADYLNGRVQKWAPDAVSGVTVVPASGGAVPGLTGIAVDAAGNVYTLQSVAAVVLKWAPGAATGVVVAGGNGSGPAANQFGDPLNIFVDASGNIYVADNGNYRVQKWAPGATTGVTVAGGNGFGSAANQCRPEAVFVDNAGNIYVTDPWINRVQKWAPGAASGVTIVTGPANSNIYSLAPNSLTGVWLDNAGDLFVATQADVVLEYPPGASLGIVIGGGNGAGAANNQLNMPESVFADGNGKVYVADYGNARVMEYVLQSSIDTVYKAIAAGTYTATATNSGGCAVSAGPIVVNPSVNPAVTIVASATSICSGAAVNFNAVAVNGGADPSYQWTVNAIGVGTDSPSFSSSSLADGDIVAVVLSGDALCVTAATAESNPITVRVSSTVAPMVNIGVSADPVCSGTAVSFLATTSGGGTTAGGGTATGGAPGLHYQWQVNGVDAGVDSAGFSTAGLADGDRVVCQVSSSDVCATAVSGPITMTVNPTPVIAPDQVFTDEAGGVLLQPKVSGDIVSYTWAPATGLSADNIADPFAAPAASQVYSLSVVSTAGCAASGPITVKVYSAVRIPNAFTPNGDGRNDVFYVMGGLPGSQVKDFSIFDRWGQRIFRVQGVASGDPAFGWNGRINGAVAPGGAYIYIVTMSSAGGAVEVYKGTVVLVR